jgi:hypothetical protein
MKKYFFLFLILSHYTIQAQNTHFGPKIGANLSYVDIIDNQLDVQSRMKLDANAGFFFRANFKKFSIQPEVYYSSNAFRLKGNLTIFSDETTKDTRLVYQYISVPLMMGYEIAKGVHIEAGPQYSWALNSGRSNGPNKNNDIGIAAGFRIDMLDAMSLFSLNFRYVYGLKDQTDRSYTLDKTYPYDFRNRSLQVSISYNFSDYYRWSKKNKIKKKK